MAGRFSKTARPKRPGAYFNFVAREPEPVLVNSLGTVVVPFTHTWGPSEEVVQLDNFGDFLRIFGQGGTTPPTYTPGYQAVHDAFRGEGVPGFGGAGTVLAFRQVGAAAAKSTKVLSNTAPATAITLQAIYNGVFGDEISVTVEADATAPSTHHNLVVYVEGIEVERYVYAKTDITDLAARLDGTGVYAGKASDWLRTTGAVTSGTALALVATAENLSAGDDGTTLLAADWTALMTAVEPWRFTLFAAQNLTDSSILTSLKTWAVDTETGQNAKGKRFMTVVGGGSGGSAEAMSAAVTRSASLADENFVNLGGGLYTDDKFGDLHPSQLTSRVAGILAARGEAMALTFARLEGLTIKTGSTEADILAAIDGGVVAFGRDSNAVAPVRIEMGVTTFISTTDDNKPYEVYSVPKFVRTMHSLETELTEFAEWNVIGKMPVNPGTRDYLRGQMETRMQAREDALVILPGWRVAISSDPAPQDTDNFVALDYEIQFARSLEQVLNTVTVG